MNAGYDKATGMFGAFDERQFNVPNHPTFNQAEQALMELLNEYAFKTEHDRAAAIAGILTAVIRPSLSLASMIH